jgi:hypothetical protein
MSDSHDSAHPDRAIGAIGARASVILAIDCALCLQGTHLNMRISGWPHPGIAMCGYSIMKNKQKESPSISTGTLVFRGADGWTQLTSIYLDARRSTAISAHVDA